MLQHQLIKNEKFTSIQAAQAGLTNILKSAEREGKFYRVLRNNEPIGILLPNTLWESLMEDFEAMNSPTYINSIKKARNSTKRYSAEEIKKELKIT